ncbi:MAG: DUF5947 family protein [Gemmatimonadota bacterium]
MNNGRIEGAGDPSSGRGFGGAASSLRRYLEPKAKPRPGERCEFCGEALAESHGHVAHLETRGMACACRPCYLLFTTRGAAGGKYVAIPDRYLAARDIGITDAQWDTLQIPVGIAFLFFNSAQGRTVAFYPSPAGATESLLPLDTWVELSHQSPLLATLEPDVEALLARKTRDGIAECYVVPIDACYELVGRMRRVWRGFDGGEDAWTEIDAFFAGVRERCGEDSVFETSP